MAQVCLQSVPVDGVMNAQISGLIYNRGGGFTNECIDVDLTEGDQPTEDPYLLPGVDMYDDDDITKILPDEASEVSGCTKYGEHYIGAKTCGDGCCALHSIWGVPVSSEHDVCWLYCTDARERLLASVPADAGELLRGRTAGAFRCLVTYFWVDLVRYARQLRSGIEDTSRDSCGAQVIWNLCDVGMRDVLLEHADIQRAEDNEQRSLENHLLSISSSLFTHENEGLVRRLCLHLGYIQGEEAEHLGNVLPAPKHDPLELFKASGVDPTQSRYSMLFQQDTAECDTLRRLFFNNVYSPTLAPSNNSPRVPLKF